MPGFTELHNARRAPCTDADITARIAVLTRFVVVSQQEAIEVDDPLEHARTRAQIAAFEAIERLAKES